MRGRAAWRRTLEVKERYLAAGDPDRLPPQSCGVGLEIVQSLRRSLLSGVDAAATDIPRDEAAVPPERLVRAARPVIDRLADQLSGMRARRRCAQGQCGPTSVRAPATGRATSPGAGSPTSTSRWNTTRPTAGSAEGTGAVVVRAIKNGDLYAITHPDWYGMVEQRHQTIAAAFRQAASRS